MLPPSLSHNNCVYLMHKYCTESDWIAGQVGSFLFATFKFAAAAASWTSFFFFFQPLAVVVFLGFISFLLPLGLQFLLEQRRTAKINLVSDKIFAKENQFYGRRWRSVWGKNRKSISISGPNGKYQKPQKRIFNDLSLIEFRMPRI